MDISAFMGGHFAPAHAPMQVQFALSFKEDYVKGSRMLVDDHNTSDGTEHEQAFDKGARVMDKEGIMWWVFYTKRGRVRVVSDDNELSEKTFPKSRLTEVDE